MKITAQQYASALYDAVHQVKNAEHDLVLDNFVKILAQNGDLSKYPEIEKEFRLLENKAKGLSQAEITVAREIQINSQIVDEINTLTKKKVQVQTKVDESLIGGMVIRVDDTLIDASVKGQLNQLNQLLNS